MMSSRCYRPSNHHAFDVCDCFSLCVCCLPIKEREFVYFTTTDLYSILLVVMRLLLIVVISILLLDLSLADC